MEHLNTFQFCYLSTCYIFFKILTYVLVSVVTICLHNSHALSTTAHFLKTEILTKALLGIQQFEFPSQGDEAKQYHTFFFLACFFFFFGNYSWQNFNYFPLNMVFCAVSFSFHVHLRKMDFQKLKPCDNSDFSTFCQEQIQREQRERLINLGTCSGGSGRIIKQIRAGRFLFPVISFILNLILK